MYPIVLTLHNVLRWVVLVLAVLAVLRGLTGWLGRKPWVPAAAGPGRVFTIAMDVQFLLGLLLYFVLSPVTGAAMEDFGAAMRVPQLRFFAVEHTFGMVLAITLAHIGRGRVRKEPPEKRGRTALIFYGLALVIILASIPWPGMPAGRPLFRM